MDRAKTKANNSVPRVINKSVRTAKGLKQGLSKMSEAVVKTKKVKENGQQQTC
jgi:hypothetical protein